MIKEKLHYTLEVQGYNYLDPIDKWLKRGRRIPKGVKWVTSFKKSHDENKRENIWDTMRPRD